MADNENTVTATKATGKAPAPAKGRTSKSVAEERAERGTVDRPTFEIEDEVLIVRIPLNRKGKQSESGKTIGHANHRTGPSDSPEFNGKPLTIQIQAWTKP